MSVLLASLIAAQLTGQSAPVWTELEAGLSYREVKVQSERIRSQGKLRVFRIDLKTHRLVPLEGRTRTQKRTSVASMAKGSDALIIVNGTYFDEHARPLGLLMDEERTLNPLRRADWGVFYVKDGRAGLVHTREWRAKPIATPEFAIQVGPRCVIEGQPVKLKAQVARRAALGIQADGSVLIALSSREILSADLARTMASAETAGGLGCTHAVMLDGGGSAQLWGSVGERRWNISGAWPVPNAVAVKRR